MLSQMQCVWDRIQQNGGIEEKKIELFRCSVGVMRPDSMDDPIESLIVAFLLTIRPVNCIRFIRLLSI